MKLSQVLFKQNIGRQTRTNWYSQGKKHVLDTYAERSLAEKGIHVIDPDEILRPKLEPLDLKKLTFPFEKPLPLDQNHPDWKENPRLSYNDNNLLVLGLPQAQLITKTVVFENELPEDVKTSAKNVTHDVHELVQRTIKSSCIFDAHQEKLPKRVDPQRLFWNYPRDFGITDVRKAFNLSKKLLNLVDCISGPEISDSRTILDNALLSLYAESERELYHFLLTMDVMVMSKNPLRPVKEFTTQDHNDFTLPSLYPMHQSIGVTRQHIYNIENLYPILPGYHKNHIHTIFIYNDPTKVKNITELEVKETQVFGRALLKVFTAAASLAKQKFGPEVKELPEPVTVQCVQSDGKSFYFSIYQLNTLNLENGEGTKNYCWTLPKLDLYKKASYVDGVPTLEAYNPAVFKRLLAFYENN